MAFTPRSSDAIIPPPPRFTGSDQDYPTIVRWINDFYQAGVVESGLFDPAYQSSGTEDIDFNDLPDPRQSTIARAQATANAAITRTVSGQFTIQESETGASIDFSDDVGTDSYIAVASASAFTGAPDPDAFSIASMAKETTGMAFTTVVAPGSGASITFDYIIILPVT